MVGALAQDNGLATIVGTRTPGPLLSGSAFKAGFGYMVGLPVAAYLTWRGGSWKAKASRPVSTFEMKPEQLLAREDPQLQKALELAKET